jgi:flagellar operon protein
MVINGNYNNRIGNIRNNDKRHANLPPAKQDSSFRSILEQHIESAGNVKFSKHAEARLDQRNIKLSDSQLKRIRAGMEKAQSKGVRDTLVLVDDMAFVVNIRSKTVITALNSDDMRENVFTNIDGAVII